MTSSAYPLSLDNWRGSVGVVIQDQGSRTIVGAGPWGGWEVVLGNPGLVAVGLNKISRVNERGRLNLMDALTVRQLASGFVFNRFGSSSQSRLTQESSSYIAGKI